MLARAAEAGADLVALPEAASFLAPNRESLAALAENEADSPSLNHLSQMARHSGAWLLIGSLLIRRSEDGQLVNRSYLVAPDGKIGPHYDKIHTQIFVDVTKQQLRLKQAHIHGTNHLWNTCPETLHG